MINNIKETLLKSGVTFFNLHRMEKGYFPTSLIKFQVDTNKTYISYLYNKNINIKNRNYIIRRFIEKRRQNNRYRYTNFTEKPRRYVKPHPSTRYGKETNTAEKTNIEEITNHQKTLAEYARRLEKIHEELKQLTINALHIIKQDRKILKETEKRHKLLEKKLLQNYEYALKKNETKESHLYYIARQLTNRLDLDPKESKRARRVIERCFDAFKLCAIHSPDIKFNKKSITESDKGPYNPGQNILEFEQKLYFCASLFSGSPTQPPSPPKKQCCCSNVSFGCLHIKMCQCSKYFVRDCSWPTVHRLRRKSTSISFVRTVRDHGGLTPPKACQQ